MLKTYIHKYPLLSFVILNYSISWTFLYPSYQLILNAEDGTFPILSLIGLIGAFGPSISAIIIEIITDGKQGVKNLLSRLLIWKVNIKWYIFVLIAPIIIYGLAVLSTKMFGYHFEEVYFKQGLKSILPYMLLALPFGPLGEELGWRGFFLPRLLQKYNIYNSSLILGSVWAVWHLASFSFPGAAIPSIFEISVWTLFLYLVKIIVESFIFTYIFLKTKGSVLIAVLFHTAFNASSNIILTIFPQVENNIHQREAIYIIYILLISILSMVLFQRKDSILKSKIK